MRIWPVIFLCTAALGCNGLHWHDPVAEHIARGNAALAQGKFDDALAAYRQAQIDAPEDARVHFNIGDVLYRQKQYAQAEQTYRQALAGAGRQLRAKAAYNLGNAQFQQGKLTDAAESYERALEIDPHDMDAKFNLELVQLLLNRAAQEAGQRERPRASEWARRRARRAEALSRQGRYIEAERLMRRTLQAEPAAKAEFGDFASRLHDLAQIFGDNP